MTTQKTTKLNSRCDTSLVFHYLTGNDAGARSALNDLLSLPRYNEATNQSGVGCIAVGKFLLT